MADWHRAEYIKRKRRRELRKLYQAGRYKFPPPPVCPIGWPEDAWIDYIEECGVWT